MLSQIKSRKFLIASIGIAVFYFSISWIYSQPILNSDVMYVIIDPLKALTENYTLSGARIDSNGGLLQINYYTGNPFFILPYIWLFGLSPEGIRVLLISFMTLSTVLSFAAYREIYNFKKAVLGVLILLNFNVWLVFRYTDYTYGILFSTILLYLFTLWKENKDIRIFYLMSFLGGWFFYFKAVAAYTFVSLFGGEFLNDYKNFFSNFEFKQLIVGFILLVAGLTPFIAFTALNYQSDAGFWLDRAVGVDDNYEEGFGLGNIVSKRMEDVNWFISKKSFPRYNWPDEIGLSVLSPIFILALIFSLTRKSNRNYTYSFLILWSLFLYVPNVMNFRQSLLLIPFIPIVLLSIFDKKQFDKEVIYNASIIILILGILFSLSNFDMYSNQAWDNESEFKWGGGDKGWYEDVHDLELNGTVVTNSYELYIASKYEFQIDKSLFVMNSTNTSIEENWSEAEGTRHYVVRFFKKGSGSASENAVYILEEGKVCDIEKRFCGMTTESTIENYNLSDPREVKINEQEFLIFR